MVGVDIRPLMGDSDLGIAKHSNFLFVQADLTKLPDLQKLLQRIVTTFGKHVHVLVNNAGMSPGKPKTWRHHLGRTPGVADPYLPERQRLMLFSTVLTVNLTVAYTMSEALKGMLVPGDSSIIHISSTRALQSEPHCEVWCTTLKKATCGI